MCTRQVHHRVQVVLDHRLRGRAGVAGNVVGAGQDHHHLWLQCQHVLREAHQHLRRGLATDATVEPALAGEESSAAFRTPAFGDRVAEEHHARLARHGLRQLRVGITIALQLRKIGQALLHETNLVGAQLVDGRLQQRVDCDGLNGAQRRSQREAQRHDSGSGKLNRSTHAGTPEIIFSSLTPHPVLSVQPYAPPHP